ncbi:MAG: M42 family metallopeptidase [Bacilli bacterium]|jgi:putative aminopeptidase FrvX|nr:M42 family metallopeptidase [Bacilli bacterium]MDD2681377.1 M42 family metallopeptidase [Bacilli bacterium]MDD3120886.1 M42 family metallopeptidase [Bacilli bacterium]MDD4063081.1 M42 family metallopeptidase [Bacilli bacterium]MDD4481639.1 M42 family metallopeptidase [Bacilli bacterium]
MKTRNRMKEYEILTNLNGISGFEKSVRDYVKLQLEKTADEILRDRLGSIFGVKKGPKGSPVIMIAGHMDEVGAMVVGITDEGMLKMQAIGGLKAEVMVSQNVNVILKEKVIQGVITSIPPHLSKGDESATKFQDLLVDIGADNKEHAEKIGIRIGQQIVPVNNYYVTEDGKKIVSKAWDDRFGCGMALEVFKELKNIDHPNTVICGCTVQEEVGLRGAATATQMIQPDLFLAVDVSPVSDYTGKPDGFGKLGAGFLMRFFDPGCIMNPNLKNYFEKIANDNNIDFQMFLSHGGTDAARAQYAGKGTLSTTIGLPGRYIHSTTTMIHIDDVEAVKKMLIAIIKDFDSDKLNNLINV